MNRHPPTDEQGMILINVLLFVAIASGILLLMISSEDSALERASRMREAARAQAVARGGETSAVVALRRDALSAPDTDNATEPWAALAERAAPIEGGSFDLAIADAQGRFNVNAVMSGDAGAVMMLGRVGAAAGLPASDVPKAVQLIRLSGPISDLRPLRLAGFDAATLTRLSGLITALPFETQINLNAATEPVLALLLDDPAAAATLIAERQRRGYLTPDDFRALRITVPPGAGFTSSLFWVRTRVRIGDTSQQLTSLIARERDPQQRLRVAVIGRWTGASPPDQAPPLPF